VKYRVEWLLSARDQLADAWIDADSQLREAITSATNRLETMLAHQADEVGESRERNERVGFFEPLIAQFAIDTLTNTVIVLDVRVYRQRD
jgi:hypothetical protein